MGKARLAWGLALVALASVGYPGIGHADAIDGNWCADDGRVMTIQGSSIATPGGQHASGNYSRHAFAYVVPAGEAYAGVEVQMVLLNEETVSVRTGPTAPEEIWQRCDVIS